MSSLRMLRVEASRSRAETTVSSSISLRPLSTSCHSKLRTGFATVSEESVLAKGMQRFVRTLRAKSRAAVSGWRSKSSIQVAPSSFGFCVSRTNAVSYTSPRTEGRPERLASVSRISLLKISKHCTVTCSLLCSKLSDPYLATLASAAK